MTDVNDRLLQASQGQLQLHPDQLKKYLGTFKERVVLTVTLSDSRQEDNQQPIALAFDRLKSQYQDLTLKINGKLGSTLQLSFLQLAQKAGLSATVVDDRTNQSPYGLLVHTNQAENCTSTDIRERYPDLWETVENLETVPKVSFWQRLFGKKEG